MDAIGPYTSVKSLNSSDYFSIPAMYAFGYRDEDEPPPSKTGRLIRLWLTAACIVTGAMIGVEYYSKNRPEFVPTTIVVASVGAGAPGSGQEPYPDVTYQIHGTAKVDCKLFVEGNHPDGACPNGGRPAQPQSRLHLLKMEADLGLIRDDFCYGIVRAADAANPPALDQFTFLADNSEVPEPLIWTSLDNKDSEASCVGSNPWRYDTPFSLMNFKCGTKEEGGRPGYAVCEYETARRQLKEEEAAPQAAPDL